ncbi:hypothetical protein GC163_21130 [bacterium]|nr:hypothetical protein [bacterium]
MLAVECAAAMRDPFHEKGTDWSERLTVLQHFQPFAFADDTDCINWSASAYYGNTIHLSMYGNRIRMAGRPPLSDSRKNNRLAVMLTDDERAAIDARAESLGKPTSTHARDVLLADAAENVLKKSARKKQS